MNMEKLKEILAAYPEVLAAYLFGSAARNRLTPMSDVDIAVLLKEPAIPEQVNLLVYYLGVDIQKQFRRQADIKILNRIRDLPFIFEIFPEGKLVFERGRDSHGMFVARKLSEYHDFLPLYKRALRNYARSLKKTQFIRKIIPVKSSMNYFHLYLFSLIFHLLS